MSPIEAALVVMMQRYLGGLLDPEVSLLEVHKLMYFLQVAGEPLRLGYVKGPYGPYAENLRHVLRHVEGHLVTGYDDRDDAPNKPLAIVPGAEQAAEQFLATAPETRAHLTRTEELVEGFETPYGLELLSTVHWVASHEGAATLDEVTRAVHAWSPRKRCFTPEQIRIAADRLTAHGWLALA